LKTQVTWVIAALLTASAFGVPASDADVISDLLAYPPQASYGDRPRVAAAQGPDVRPTPQYLQGAYATKPASPRQVITAPTRVEQQDRRPVGRTLAASQPIPQRQASAKAVDKSKAVSTRPATARRPSGQPRVAAAQAAPRQAVRSYPQNYPAQAQAPVPTRYYSPPAQTSYYSNYPQQSRYAAPPNYYQGYAYQGGWGGAGQAAACPPGRA